MEMSATKNKAGLLNRYSLIGFSALSVVAIVTFPILNNAVGPIGTIQAKVMNVSMDGSYAYSLPKERAQLQLLNGNLVQSVIPHNIVVLNGDTVTVEIYQYRLTGSKEYRVTNVEK
jgi:translation initiation factor IF-1